MDYVMTTWVNQEAKFPAHLWNHCQNYSHRTTNHLEGWHHRLKRLVGKPHPNLYEMIQFIKLEQDMFELKVNSLDAGNAPKRSAKKYIDLNNKIMRLTYHYLADQSSTVTRVSFMKAIGFALHLSSDDRHDNQNE